MVAAFGCGNVDLAHSCAPPLMRCGDVCVDTNSDVENCGACGTTCEADQACSQGTCSCAGTGGMLCSGTCVDTMTDTANCGGCGSACDSGAACTAGACAATCGAPFSACTDPATSKMFCTDTTTDVDNCGTCGNACDLLNSCSFGACVPTFGWETLAAQPSTEEAPGASDYTPADQSSYYLLNGTSLVRYDRATDAFTTLSPAPVNLNDWPGMAWVGNALWAIGAGEVLEYDIPTDTWTAIVASGVHANIEAGTTHDTTGKIYSFTQAGEVAIYDTVAGGSVTYVATTILGTTSYEEPHLAFDEGTGLLYVAPNFVAPNLYSYNPATGAVVALASNPGGGMNDAFCGDRHGHLYAAGDTNDSNTSFYSYDITNNVWTALPALPFGHGDDGACTVMAEGGGYLYETPGDSLITGRIRLH
ncbi:MAG TPA: hypothetical protein VGF94_06990 [Kofleriaceae bacterium]